MYLTQCNRDEEKKKEKKKEKQVMEQDNINNNNNNNNIENKITREEDREVAQILVELQTMILDLEEPLLRLLPFTWGCRRIRSAIFDYNNNNNNNTPTTTTTCAAPLPPPPPPPLHHGGAAVAPPPPSCEVAVSPATPLSLSLTESDDKVQKPLKWKASLKRKKEYYLKSIEDLTKRKSLLNQEIDNVKRYKEQLKDFNLKLKARKEELMSETRKPNLGVGWPMHLVYSTTVNSTNSMAENQQYVTLMLNQTCGPHQICNNNNEGIAHYVSGHHPTTSSLPSSSSPSSALGMVKNNNNNSPNSCNNVGPLGNFDLNVISEELVHVEPCQPLDVNKDLSRVLAAQARQRRIQINRLKNNHTGNSKTRYSYG